MKCPNCNQPMSSTNSDCIDAESCREMARFWRKVAAHPGNNDSSREFAKAESDHWFGVAANIEAVQNGGMLA